MIRNKLQNKRKTLWYILLSHLIFVWLWYNFTCCAENERLDSFVLMCLLSATDEENKNKLKLIDKS